MVDDTLKSFILIIETVKEQPLLFITDGHMTQHVTMQIILLAMQENITILKLLPHCTYLLQVLDKTGFGLLKLRWENLLAEQANVYRTSSSLSEFVNFIWKEGLNCHNIIKGFETTSTFPVDRPKYPLSCLEPRVLENYNEWRATCTTTLNWVHVDKDIDLASNSSPNKENIQPVPSTETALFE